MTQQEEIQYNQLVRNALDQAESLLKEKGIDMHDDESEFIVIQKINKDSQLIIERLLDLEIMEMKLTVKIVNYAVTLPEINVNPKF